MLNNSGEYRSSNRRHDQRVYKYMKANVAKIVLHSRKLRWSSPVLFNDPFDITQELRLNFDDGQLMDVMADRVASLIEQGNFLSSVEDSNLAHLFRVAMHATPDVRQVMVSNLRKGIQTNTSETMQAFTPLKEMWTKIVPTFRILCLSELNDITPMWFGYADEYKGVVLEFSPVDELGSAFLSARPVVYQDTLPAIADVNSWVNCALGQGGLTYEYLFTEYLYVKTTAWSYEKEWRIVMLGARPGESGFFGDYAFDPRDLTGIYFGSRCPEDDRLDLLALLSHGLENVAAYEAFPDSHHARFRFCAVTR
jgi:hypothetical protein